MNDPAQLQRALRERHVREDIIQRLVDDEYDIGLLSAMGAEEEADLLKEHGIPKAQWRAIKGKVAEEAARLGVAPPAPPAPAPSPAAAPAPSPAASLSEAETGKTAETERTAALAMVQVLRGLSSLHSKRIVHNRVRPCNVVRKFDRHGRPEPNVILIDLSHSKIPKDVAVPAVDEAAASRGEQHSQVAGAAAEPGQQTLMSMPAPGVALPREADEGDRFVCLCCAKRLGVRRCGKCGLPGREHVAPVAVIANASINPSRPFCSLLDSQDHMYALQPHRLRPLEEPTELSPAREHLVYFKALHINPDDVSKSKKVTLKAFVNRVQYAQENEQELRAQLAVGSLARRKGHVADLLTKEFKAGRLMGQEPSRYVAHATSLTYDCNGRGALFLVLPFFDGERMGPEEVLDEGATSVYQDPVTPDDPLQSDIYAAGMTFYQFLQQEQPSRDGITRLQGPFADFIKRATDPVPGNRFGSAEEMREALEALIPPTEEKEDEEEEEEEEEKEEEKEEEVEIDAWSDVRDDTPLDLPLEDPRTSFRERGTRSAERGEFLAQVRDTRFPVLTELSVASHIRGENLRFLCRNLLSGGMSGMVRLSICRGAFGSATLFPFKTCITTLLAKGLQRMPALQELVLQGCGLGHAYDAEARVAANAANPGGDEIATNLDTILVALREAGADGQRLVKLDLADNGACYALQSLFRLLLASAHGQHLAHVNLARNSITDEEAMAFMSLGPRRDMEIDLNNNELYRAYAAPVKVTPRRGFGQADPGPPVQPAPAAAPTP